MSANHTSPPSHEEFFNLEGTDAGDITLDDLRTELYPALEAWLSQKASELAFALGGSSGTVANHPVFMPTPQPALDPTVVYVPRITLDPIEVADEPSAPLYPAYRNIFPTGEAAKAHRRQARGDRKSDPHAAHVKRYGRGFWVKRIYTAMIDNSMLEDGIKSTHYNRFAVKAAFAVEDIEATAHQIFEKACAVHERGWNRYAVYHREAVRGSLVDASKNCVESRLQRICQLLQKNKSLCNDALQGGLTLAQLVDNPYLRAGSKGQNNKGNLVRGQRLEAGRRLLDGSVQAPVPTPAPMPATPATPAEQFSGDVGVSE